MIDPQLMSEYYAAQYEIACAGNFDDRSQVIELQLGQELDSRISQCAWSIIFSYNPHSKILTLEENLERQAELLKVCELQGWDYLIARGGSEEWSWEYGVLIWNLDLHKLKDLGVQFRQNAVIFKGDELEPELVECF